MKTELDKVVAAARANKKLPIPPAVAKKLLDSATAARDGIGAVAFYDEPGERDAYTAGVYHTLALLLGEARTTDGIETALQALTLRSLA